MNEYIRFHCLACGKRLKAKSDDAGGLASCLCGYKLMIPGRAIVYRSSQPEDTPQNCAEEESHDAELRDEQEGISIRDFKLLGLLLLPVLAVFITVWSLHAFLRAERSVQATIAAAVGAVAVMVVSTAVVTVVRKCRWWEGVAYTAIGLAILAVTAAMVVSFAMADWATQKGIIVVVFVTGGLALSATIVSRVKECGWWEGLGYTLKGICTAVVFLVLVILILAMLSAPSQARHHGPTNAQKWWWLNRHRRG